MSLTEYYGLTALPATAILLAGGATLLVTRRKSAQVRQFVCGATLASLLLIAAVPTLPQGAKPTLPAAITRSLPTPPRFELTPKKDDATEAFQTQTTIAPSRLDLLAVLALIGVAISTLLALRLAGSLLAVARLRKQARPASSRIRGLAEENVRVVESLSSPVALGGFKPVILLPAEAESWPEDRIRAVLIHEQAHLRNGDPNWQLLAEVACLLHWFNPLAWFVRGTMRREAERAADDAVLRAGVRPSDYASELVAFAAKMGADRQPVAWTAFTRKSGVSGRVRAILTPHLERKPMTKKTRITAIASVALAAYGVSAYAFQDREAVPTSSHPDVRAGKTIAASPQNNFVGKFADGRNVEIVQVSRRMPSGEIVSWRPDGTLLSASEQIPYSYRHSLKVLDTHTRYIFARYPSSSALPEINAGFGSSAIPHSRPSTMVFAGGGNLNKEDGLVTTLGFVGLPAEDSDEIPVSFGVSDSLFEDHGVIDVSNPMVRNVSVTQLDRAKDDHRSVIDKFQKTHPGPLTLLEFTLILGDDAPGDLQIAAFDKEGRPIAESNSSGNFGYGEALPLGPAGRSVRVLHQGRYFSGDKTKFSSFRLRTRKSQQIEIRGLAANPKRP